MRARLSTAEETRDAAEKRSAALSAVLDIAPIAGFVWRTDGSEAVLGSLPGTSPSFADFRRRLDPAHAAWLATAVEALRTTGGAFADTVTLGDGSAYAVTGR